MLTSEMAAGLVVHMEAIEDRITLGVISKCLHVPVNLVVPVIRSCYVCRNLSVTSSDWKAKEIELTEVFVWISKDEIHIPLFLRRGPEYHSIDPHTVVFISEG